MDTLVIHPYPVGDSSDFSAANRRLCQPLWRVANVTAGTASSTVFLSIQGSHAIDADQLNVDQQKDDEGSGSKGPTADMPYRSD